MHALSLLKSARVVKLDSSGIVVQRTLCSPPLADVNCICRNCVWLRSSFDLALEMCLATTCVGVSSRMRR